MKNWKTSLFGTLLSIGTIIQGLAPADSSLHKISVAAIAIGGLGLGNSAKDKDVTGAGMTARTVKD